MLRSLRVKRDPEAQALRRLAKRDIAVRTRRPLNSLQGLVDLARELTSARYSALVVIDEVDNVEGFVASGLTREEERRLKSAPLGHGPLGSMRKDGLAVRIDDLAEHAAAFGFPPKHPPMRTLMGLPLDVEGRLRGALYVTDRDGGRPFRDGDQTALAVLAQHAGRVLEASWF